MPELPEVETVRRGLSELLPGRRIVSERHDTDKSFPNAPADVSAFLIGASVKDVRRRAKVLLIDLSTEYTLVIHLKMTGQLVFIREHDIPSLPKSPEAASLQVSDRAPASADTWVADASGDLEAQSTTYNAGRTSSNGMSADVLTSDVRVSADVRVADAFNTQSPDIDTDSGRGVDPSFRFGAGHPNDSLVGQLPDRSTRVELTFEDGSALFFNDQRKFGWMKLYPTLEVPNIAFMQNVGPEPLEDAFGPSEFIARVRRRNGTTIKAAILDQTVLAGVGNIYADESLWAARIHPARRVRDVSDDELAQLLVEIKAVMTLAIEKGGSTNKNYVNTEGKRGSYMDFARAFRRDGLPCPRHPDVLIEKIRVAGRGTHICPVCQPE